MAVLVDHIRLPIGLPFEQCCDFEGSLKVIGNNTIR